MSGRSYGAIKVTNADDTDQNENVDSAPSLTTTSNEEAAPLLSTSSTTAPSYTTPTTNINNDNVTEKSTQTDPHPLQTLSTTLSTHWTSLTFNWISPLLSIGNTIGQLNINDLELLPLPEDCKTEEVYDVFLKCWNLELGKFLDSRRMYYLLYLYVWCTYTLVYVLIFLVCI